MNQRIWIESRPIKRIVQLQPATEALLMSVTVDTSNEVYDTAGKPNFTRLRGVSGLTARPVPRSYIFTSKRQNSVNTRSLSLSIITC